MPSAAAKSSAALTLMSSDVDRIALTTVTAYEIWAGILETAIALYLLERQIGWACIAPVLLGISKFDLIRNPRKRHAIDTSKLLSLETQSSVSSYRSASSNGSRLSREGSLSLRR